jgi:DNA-binding PadR family transcriptional regulator
MLRSRSLSPHAKTILALLDRAGADWSHGYALCRAAGVKSGTLYPLLIRLESQGHLEARWEEPAPGRPPRHVYRLTATGRELARNSADAAPRGLSPRMRPA